MARQDNILPVSINHNKYIVIVIENKMFNKTTRLIIVTSFVVIIIIIIRIGSTSTFWLKNKKEVKFLIH